MKWSGPKDGQRRVIKRFAWFPHRLRGTNDWIWFASYWVEQSYYRGTGWCDGDHSYTYIDPWR